GDPHRRLRTIHVAGTNGKGSTCATLDALLRAQGLRVGRYTSPHLVDFRERFLVDGVPVDAARIVDFVDRWTPEVERLGATFFEATTAMAFEFFAADGVDVAVIETGLGGRLDATNVVTPLVAGVTNIGIDHVEYLGATREEIAFEKAGIFKPGVCAVIGEPESGIRELLRRYAQERGASPVQAVFDDGGPTAVQVTPEGTSFTLAGKDYRTPLLGAHQANNAAMAIAMLECVPPEMRPTSEAIARGLAAVHLPGRFHRSGRYIFDVAHNPAGATVLARTLKTVQPPRPVVAVFSVLADKDWRGMMDHLAPAVDHFVITNAPTSPSNRVWSNPEPLAYARERNLSAALVRDFDRALARAADSGATVLVTGSFHTVGDAMARLEVSPTAG
ncbi:MAG: bifunctional folylpolyglutamate synthase/dihydrofolate synthase, partial [Gemmatimonadetes bacterium]|nr:bifunctional folylpolyglutamate synthase/dihydrofolate synthase [Gemmatimonadota bacterium]